MGSILNTRLGRFVKAVSSLTTREVENVAYNASVLNQMADLNTDSQLYDKGVFPDGSPTGDYAPFTVAEKRANNEKFSHMTFKDTGGTYDSVRYLFDGSLKVNYTDEHDLVNKYGNIFGLTSESKDFVKPEIAENIRDLIKSKL